MARAVAMTDAHHAEGHRFEPGWVPACGGLGAGGLGLGGAGGARGYANAQQTFFAGAAVQSVAEGECRSRRQRGGGGGSDRSLAQDMADALAFSSASRPRNQDVGMAVSSGISELLPAPCIKLGADIGLTLGKAP